MKTLKRTLCLVLVAVMALSLFAVAASAKKLSDYDDAASVSAEYKTAVDYATQLGILEGMGADTYGAKGNLTRAQLATMLYRMVTGDVAKKYVANYAGGAAFADVKADAWYAGYVNYAADKGLLEGIGNNKYDPNSALTGYQTLAAFLRALGYGVNGEFVGATWKAGVTKFADVIDGTIVADWSKPISREVAAQLILNTMSAKMVKWDAASKSYVEIDGVKFGYFYEKDTLAEVVFNLSETPVTAAVDGFEAPVAAWKDITTNKNVVEVALDCVKTYTTKVDGCTLLKDLGYAESNTTATVQFTHWNGFEAKTFENFKHASNGACATQPFGGQGVLTKVYAVGKDQFAIVQIDTFLAKVAAVTPASHGVAASSTLYVYTAKNNSYETVTVATTAYAKDSYVLVNMYENDQDQDVAIILGAAPSVTATFDKLSKAASIIDLDKWVWTVGGKDYKANVEWNYDYDDVNGGMNYATNYVWYFDQYGNIIGCTDAKTTYTYGVVDSIYWVQNGHGAGYADTNLVYMNGEKANSTKITKAIDHLVDGVDEIPEWYTPDTDVLHAEDEGRGLFLNANVSDENTLNTDYYSDIFAIGADSITQVGTKIDGTVSLEKGQPGIELSASAGVSGKDTTVYLLKYKDATGAVAYASYTGYKAMPSVVNAKVEYITDDTGAYKFADFVFVDVVTSGYIKDTVANTVIAYVVDATADNADEDAKGITYTYNVFVDGKPATVKVYDDKAVYGAVSLASIYGDTLANKFVKIVSGSDGYVDSVANVTAADIIVKSAWKEGNTYVNATDGTSMMFHFDTLDPWTFYNVADAEFYFVQSNGTLVTKTVAEVTAGYATMINVATTNGVYVVFNADNTVAAVYVF